MFFKKADILELLWHFNYELVKCSVQLTVTTLCHKKYNRWLKRFYDFKTKLNVINK